MPDIADATSDDALVENTDDFPTDEDGPQDVPQVPVAEDDVEAEEV